MIYGLNMRVSRGRLLVATCVENVPGERPGGHNPLVSVQADAQPYAAGVVRVKRRCNRESGERISGVTRQRMGAVALALIV